MKNTWPNGKRQVMAQAEHIVWNAEHYPGTRQLCDYCGQPTGRTEDSTIYSNAGETLCEVCCDWVEK